MKKWQQEEWQRVSRWYDEALTLAPEARAAWLAHLAAESGSMVAKLTELLSAAGEIETGDFLAAPPHLASHCPTDYSLDQVVGPYRLEALLGRGGMAEVWRASRIDGHLRREVALKLPFLPPQSAIQRSAWVQRFERERDILAGLRHPNVAALLDAGVADDGQAWLALEYVDGEPITAHCDSRRLGVRERLQLFRQVLLAMQHAHAHLVIHRDLKPGNILVTTAGEVRLLDFGIAKLLAEEQQGADATELTLIAGRPMTPAYASPEQVLGRSLTTASDIYSLGVLFYELICGLSPYDLHHSSTAEIERAILDADPRVPSRRAIGPEQAGVRGLSVKALRALLAPELDAIALRAMAKPPADRYPSADAMRADLDRWLHGEPVLARPPAAWLTVRKFAARHRFGVAAGATAFVALLAVTGMALVQRQQAQREASRAVASRDFLLEMFRLADPDQSRGAALTAKDLLEAGRKKAFEGLADQPELQADLLTAIGGVQADIGEMTHADTTFGQAIELYGREGRTRGLALTEILRADNARRLLDYRTAAEFLKRAEVHAAELGEDQEVQARLSLTQGRIWGGTGQLESAAKAFQSSVERTARLWGENDERTILALAGLAEMQSRMPGHGQDAVATLDEAFRRADRNPNLHPGRRADLEIFRVYVALDSGRYRVAHEQATGAAQRCDREIGAGSELCQGLKRLQLTAALRTGRTKEASVLAIALMPTVTNTASPARQARALIQVTRALAASGQLAAHVGLRQQLIRFGRNEGEPGQQEPLRMSALLAQAEALLREERPREALDWVGEALRRYPPGQQDADLKARAEMFSALALQALGRHPEALDALAGAQAIYRQTLGPRHPDTLLCGLNRVRSLVALGRSAEARTLIEDSLPEMRDALGEASPVVLSIEKWRADLAAARSVDFHPARIRDFFS